MKNNYIKHRIQIDPELHPFLDTLTERLTRAGFKQLTEEAATEILHDYVVVLYKKSTKSFSAYIIDMVSASGISFRHKKDQTGKVDPCVTAPDLEAVCHGYVDFHMQHHHYDDYLYKVISTAPIIGEKLVKNAGFLPLSKATPTDIPRGSVVLLRDQDGTITTVIARELSDKFENDPRFLFWKHSPIVRSKDGEWQSDVLMGHRTPHSKYHYLLVC